jgi:hypothetical protein
MVSSKIERANRGPNILEVFLGATLSLALGVAAALFYLIVQPVQVGLAEAKAEPGGPVTYVKGSQDEDHGKQWLRKKQLFTEGTSVDVNEDELNAWMTAGTEPEPPKAANAKPPAPGQPAAPAASGKLIQFGTPNFRIANKMLQIGSEGEIDLDMLGIKRPLILQTSGRFVKIGGRIIFVPAQFYIGSCPLHKLPGVAAFVFDHLLAEMKVPGDIAAAWKKLASVSVQENSLLLTVQ